jgi:hypothetical protein
VACFRCVLKSRVNNGDACRARGHTNNEVDLFSKFECEESVTHELMHLDGLNNAVFSNTLLNVVRHGGECIDDDLTP